jgi:hypothetical protein
MERQSSWLLLDSCHFAKQVQHLLTDLRSTARLKPMKPNIRLTLTGDGRGHIRVEGIGTNTFGSENELHFCFQIDQTYLSKIINALVAADGK